MRVNRILFLCFLAFCLIFSSCAPSISAESATMERETDILEQLCFLGDSTTAHMRSRAPLGSGNLLFVTKERYLNLDSKILNTKLEDPRSGALQTIPELMASHQPRYLLITLGIDYAVYYYRDNQQALGRCYEKLLDAIRQASPDTRIILGAIFPVTADSASITNEMIDRANDTIRELAAARGLPFADNNAILKDKSGYLLPAFCSSADGIHLTESAYRKIFEHLREIAPTWKWREKV